MRGGKGGGVMKIVYETTLSLALPLVNCSALLFKISVNRFAKKRKDQFVCNNTRPSLLT